MSSAFDAADALQNYMETIAAPYQGVHDAREFVDVRWDGRRWQGLAWVRVGAYRNTESGTTAWLGACADNCDDAAHCYAVLLLKLRWAAEERAA